MNDQLGASLTDGGCNFRVWAPHAEEVRVLLQCGEQWRHQDPVESVDLTRSAEGYWTGFVPGVEAGRLYRYEIQNDGHTFQRLDAAARDVIHSELTRHDPTSENASIVVTNQPFDWTPFDTPRFNNFLIYQFHCGTFAGRNDHFDKRSRGFPIWRASCLTFGSLVSMPSNCFPCRSLPSIGPGVTTRRPSSHRSRPMVTPGR